MALESEVPAAAASREREASSPDRRPELGTAAAVALGQALDTTPHRVRLHGYPEVGTPLTRLRAQLRLRNLLEQLEEIDVKEAMRAGASYEDVGRALGLSRSAAHRKHGGKR